MKKYSIILLFSLFAFSALLSGCGVLIEPSSWPGITADEDTVYIAYQGQVHALQLNNGNKRWSFPAEADSNVNFYAAPVLTSDGQLLVGSYSTGGNNGNALFSLDTNQGQQQWVFEDVSNRFIASPLANGEAIFAPNADNTLYKLDLNGNLISNWSFEANEPLWAQPVSDGDNIYLASMDHHVYALSATSGRIHWTSVDLGSAIASPAFLGEDETLYVGTFGSQIIALNSTNGRILWEAMTEDWVWASPIVAGGKLYVGDQSGIFFVLDAKTGNEIWRMEADGSIVGSALLLDDKIYFATELGSVYMLETSGENSWKFSIIKQIEGRVLGPLIAAGDLILIGLVDAENILIAIDYNGNQQWRFSIDN